MWPYRSVDLDFPCQASSHILIESMQPAKSSFEQVRIPRSVVRSKLQQSPFAGMRNAPDEAGCQTVKARAWQIGRRSDDRLVITGV
jgi:hypothetical protein